MPDIDDNLVFKGPWASGESYAVDDMVTDGSRSYACNTAHTSAEGNSPPNADFWDLIGVESSSAAYATVAEYRLQRTKTTVSDSDDLFVGRQLLASTRHIDQSLHQSFSKDDAVTSRLYTGNGKRLLNVKNIAALNGLIVKVDDDFDGICEVTLDAGDFELRPLDPVHGGETWPWTGLYLPEWNTTRGCWEKDHRVEVTAIHGWASVPQAIWVACIELTAILRIETPRATRRIDEMGNVLGMSRAAADVIESLQQGYYLPLMVAS